VPASTVSPGEGHGPDGTSFLGWDRRGWGHWGTALLPVLFSSLPSEPHVRGGGAARGEWHWRQSSPGHRSVLAWHCPEHPRFPGVFSGSCICGQGRGFRAVKGSRAGARSLSLQLAVPLADARTLLPWQRTPPPWLASSRRAPSSRASRARRPSTFTGSSTTEVTFTLGCCSSSLSVCPAYTNPAPPSRCPGGLGPRRMVPGRTRH